MQEDFLQYLRDGEIVVAGNAETVLSENATLPGNPRQYWRLANIKPAPPAPHNTRAVRCEPANIGCCDS